MGRPCGLFEDLTGRQFGNKTVLKHAGKKRGHKQVWLVQCNCGHKFELASQNAKIIQPCKKCAIAPLKVSARQATITVRLASYMSSVKKRSLSWGLTREQFETLVEGDCFYCGAAPKITRTGRQSYPLNGIDRMVNSLGYFPENCVSCCECCNKSKLQFSVHEFIGKCQRVADRWGQECGV